MSRIEPAIILNKLSFMDRYLNYLEEYESVPLEDYRRSLELQLAVERLIQLIVQVGIDINFYILKGLNAEQPKYSTDAVLKIAELGVVNQILATRLSESVKLRNLLVHLYENINPDIVHASIQDVLRDYPQYQQSLIQYLDSLEQPNS